MKLFPRHFVAGCFVSGVQPENQPPRAVTPAARHNVTTFPASNPASRWPTGANSRPLLLALLAGLVFLTGSNLAAAPRALAAGEVALVRALYGETCGESYACKMATAQALLNRGTLRGVYGKASPLLRRINARAWADCVRALAEARRQPDVTHGARFWASRQDLGKPYLRGLVCTAQVGGHWFFRTKAES